MAEPGDPRQPEQTAPAHDHALDDLIGFTSPASLAGRERPVEPAPEPDHEPVEVHEDLFEPEPVVEPEPFEAEPETVLAAEPPIAPEEPVFVRPPEPEAAPEPEPDLFDAPRPANAAPERPAPTPVPTPTPAPRSPSDTPAWAMETPPPPPVSRHAASDRPTFGRAGGPVEPPEGAMGLYTIYALILFAVPTLGVSALIALFMIYGRAEPRQALALSHYVYQKRTLFIAAIAAVLGIVLIAVNLGVFVLFLLAVWVLVRGAAGLLRLSGSRPIARPKHWLI